MRKLLHAFIVHTCKSMTSITLKEKKSTYLQGAVFNRSAHGVVMLRFNKNEDCERRRTGVRSALAFGEISATCHLGAVTLIKSKTSTERTIGYGVPLHILVYFRATLCHSRIRVMLWPGEARLLQTRTLNMCMGLRCCELLIITSRA